MRNRVEAEGIGVLKLRQVTPRRSDDPVDRHVGGGGVGAGGGCPPWKDIRIREDSAGRVK